MKTTRVMLLGAVLLRPVLLGSLLLAVGLPMHVGAQSAAPVTSCPKLVADSGLHWDAMQFPGLLLCRAIRESDASEAFAVTLSRNSPFKPRRSDRAEPAEIDGRKGYWYRSEVAGKVTEVRETLVELGNDRVAHISLQAASAEQLGETQQQVQRLQFKDVLLSSN